MRACVLVLAVLVAACGASRPQVARRGSSGPAEIVGEIEGASLAMVPRATEGRTLVSIWIDAGSRDAEPVSIATLAAWSATAGTEVAARVLPDGTELSLGCETTRIDACIETLARVLATRAPDEEAIGAASLRLRATRRGAHGDEARLADRLAVAALLGDERGLDPLAGTDDAADASAISAFLAAHWGPSRALVIVVGDAREDRVRDAIATRFQHLPAALAPRADRTITPRIGARAAVGSSPHASVAIAVQGSLGGAAIARQVLDEIEGTSASVFPLRGAEIVLVRGADAGVLAESLTHARALASEGARGPIDDDDPRSIAARLGASWVARADALLREGGLGIGAVLEGDRGDTDADDPDALARAEAERELGALALAAVQPATGDVERAQLGAAISLRSRDGARAIARHEAVGRVAVALTIESRASDEPASSHGRRALLARLLERCAAGGTASGSAMAGGAVAGFVAEHAIGVVIEVVPERAIDAIERATGCARDPGLGAAVIEEHRARAIASMRDDDRQRALAAIALSPGAPAIIAPRGTLGSLAAIDAGSLARTWQELARRDRVTVAVVGEIDEEVVVRAALIGVRRLPVGSERARDVVRMPVSEQEIVAARASDARIEVVLALRDPEPTLGGALPGARAALRALAAAIESPTTQVSFRDAGAGAGGAWIALVIRADEDALATLASTVARARAVALARLDVELARELERAREERAWAGASVSELARRLASEREGDAPGDEASSAAARSILAAPARWVIARPAAASWRRGGD